MPSYPYLFDIKDKAEPDEQAVNLPPGVAPSGKVVVPKPETLDLVKYLQSLNREYPVLPPQPREASGAAPTPAQSASQPASAS